METTIVTQAKGKTARTSGIVLIALGVAFLLSQLIPGFGQVVWAAAFLGGGAFLYGVYKNDTQKWGWALSAYSLALIGVLNVVALLGLGGIFPVVLLSGFAAPFLYAYSQNTKQWGWLIPAVMFLFPASAIVLGLVWSWIPVLLIGGGAYMLVKANSDEQTPQISAPKYAAAIASDQPSKAVTKSPVAEMRPIDTGKPQV